MARTVLHCGQAPSGVIAFGAQYFEQLSHQGIVKHYPPKPLIILDRVSVAATPLVHFAVFHFAAFHFAAFSIQIPLVCWNRGGNTAKQRSDFLHSEPMLHYLRALRTDKRADLPCCIELRLPTTR